MTEYGCYKCQVCHSIKAQYRHFGALTCEACAAFFRRSIAKRRTYRPCASLTECANESQKPCRSCRMQRCFRVGMQADAVQSAPLKETVELSLSPPSLTATLISRPNEEQAGNLTEIIRRERRVVQHNRNYYLRNKCNYQAFPDLATPNDIQQMRVTNGFELDNFIRYMNNTGAFSHLHGPPLQQTPFVQDLFTQWTMYEAAVCTANFGVPESNLAHFLDGRYIPGNEAALCRLYQHRPGLRDPETLARATIDLTRNLANPMASLLRRSDLDDTELAVLVHIIFALQDNLPIEVRTQLISQRNTLLRELAGHYTSTGQDICVRMGVLIDLIEPIQALARMLKENMIHVQLHSRKRIAPSYGELYFPTRQE